MTEQILSDLGFIGPEIALTAALLAAILADLAFRRMAAPGGFIALAGLAVSALLLAGRQGEQALLFGGMLAVDPFAWYFQLMVLVSAAAVVVFSMQSAELAPAARPMGEYYPLLLALTLGLMLMAGASNLLMMYLAMELSSLSSYVLAGYTREAPDSSEASLKYLIYGAVASGLMLYGASILYGLTGSLGFQGVNSRLAEGGINTVPLLLAGLLVLAGLGYKISAVPFHSWTPDVYEGAPIAITAFLSVASKAAGFALLIRFLKATFIDAGVAALPAGAWATLSGFDWPTILAVVSALTMTVGNLIAVWQNNMKRLLAYSSIAHAGTMLMGLVVLTGEGIAAVMVYMAVYLFMNLGAFYVVMRVADKTGSEDIEDYKGLGARAPFLSVAFSVFLVSLTGLPPTAGFVGKLYVFAAAINGGWIWLAVVGALNGVIALYYYVRVMRNMYLRTGEGGSLSFGPLSTGVVLALLVPTLLFGVYFSPLVNLAQSSARLIGLP
ncbi:MAG: NADH-quinone oxidoreductase subunit N [Bacteroidota bacterium]